VQEAFLDGQIAENEFAWAFATMKYCFIDFIKVAL
jgi:hypothetical protein